MNKFSKRRLELYGTRLSMGRRFEIRAADIWSIEEGLLDYVPAGALLKYAAAMGVRAEAIPKKKKVKISDLVTMPSDILVMAKVSQAQRFEILCALTEDHMHERAVVEFTAKKLGLR